MVSNCMMFGTYFPVLSIDQMIKPSVLCNPLHPLRLCATVLMICQRIAVLFATAHSTSTFPPGRILSFCRVPFLWLSSCRPAHGVVSAISVHFYMRPGLCYLHASLSQCEHACFGANGLDVSTAQIVLTTPVLRVQSKGVGR